MARPALFSGKTFKTLYLSAGTSVLVRSSLALAAAALVTAPLPAQDVNISIRVDSIEALFRAKDFEILDWMDTRFEGDRTQRVVLRFEDSTKALAKWAMAPREGIGVFNNQPRYEIAAYEFQKLFLDEPEYVVPPTVARCVSVHRYREMQHSAHATFSGTESVLVILQYWLWNVTSDDVWDKGRFERDTVYARHFANLNLFTFLIRHSDANRGNVLISSISSNPRIFAVDNGVAFSRREESDRGTKWRRLAVKRLPRKTVDRLRAVTREELDRHLSVVAQFRQIGDQLVPMAPTEPLFSGLGVRRTGDVVQLGLTDDEIGEIWGRIQKVLDEVDEGKIVLF